MEEIILEYLFELPGPMVSSVIETQGGSLPEYTILFFYLFIFFEITGLLVLLLNATLFDLSTRGKSMGLDWFLIHHHSLGFINSSLNSSGACLFSA